MKQRFLNLVWCCTYELIVWITIILENMEFIKLLSTEHTHIHQICFKNLTFSAQIPILLSLIVKITYIHSCEYKYRKNAADMIVSSPKLKTKLMKVYARTYCERETSWDSHQNFPLKILNVKHKPDSGLKVNSLHTNLPEVVVHLRSLMKGQHFQILVDHLKVQMEWICHHGNQMVPLTGPNMDWYYTVDLQHRMPQLVGWHQMTGNF